LLLSAEITSGVQGRYFDDREQVMGAKQPNGLVNFVGMLY
jgi:hypothetical protein